MVPENHTHCRLDGTSQRILRENPRRNGLILQNNGVNVVYLTFGRAAVADNTSFKIAPEGVWVMDVYVPCGEASLIGTAGDMVSILESNIYDYDRYGR